MENKEIAPEKLQLFRKTIETLNKHNISYWIDQGSLLGLIRNGKFLSWDHDVDLGIWRKDAPKLKRLLEKEVLTTGVRASFLPYVVKMREIDNDSIPVNIRVYFKKKNHAISEFRSVVKRDDEEVLRMNKQYKKLVVLLGTQIAVLRSKKKNLKMFKELLYIRMKMAYYLARREVLKTRIILFRVDASFFKSFRKFPVYGYELPIPEKSEEYIKLKYGADWETPRTDWVWYKEDGALYNTKNFSRNYRGMFYMLRGTWTGL